MLCLAQTKRFIDPSTGECQFEDTDLVQRARFSGMDDTILLNLSTTLIGILQNSDDDDELSQSQLASLVPEGYSTAPMSVAVSEAVEGIKRAGSPNHRLDVTDLKLLSITQLDILNDGERSRQKRVRLVHLAEPCLLGRY